MLVVQKLRLQLDLDGGFYRQGWEFWVPFYGHQVSKASLNLIGGLLHPFEKYAHVKLDHFPR